MSKTLRQLAEESRKNEHTARVIPNDEITIITEMDRISVITPITMVVSTPTLRANSLRGYRFSRDMYFDVVMAAIMNASNRAGFFDSSFSVERGSIYSLKSPILEEPKEYQNLTSRAAVVPINKLGSEGIQKVIA